MGIFRSNRERVSEEGVWRIRGNQVLRGLCRTPDMLSDFKMRSWRMVGACDENGSNKGQ
jgi:hypothetical protein